MTAGPPRSPMVAAFGVATLVILVLAAVEITVHGGWPTAVVTVLLGVWGAVLVVGLLACGGLALVFTAEAVHRRRARRRQRADERAWDAQFRQLPDADLEALGRAVGLLLPDGTDEWDRP